jgi:hypothetical protein
VGLLWAQFVRRSIVYRLYSFRPNKNVIQRCTICNIGKIATGAHKRYNATPHAKRSCCQIQTQVVRDLESRPALRRVQVGDFRGDSLPVIIEELGGDGETGSEVVV